MLYKYIDQYQQFDLPGLYEHSRAPRAVANKTPEVLEKESIRVRDKHPRWGGPKLLFLLEDIYPKEELPGLSTVNLILKRNGLIKEWKRRRKIEPIHPIFEPKRPNEVWSADFKRKFRMANGVYCYSLAVADSYSQYVFAAKGMYAANTKNTKPVFIDIFRRYGLPEQMHTDNGAPLHTCERVRKTIKAFGVVYGIANKTRVFGSGAS